MSVFFANIVWILHMLLILFILIVPFMPNVTWPILVLHVTSIFSLMVHWSFNDDSCFLTLVECSLRGVDTKESFMHSIVSPVYKISDESLQTIVYRLTPILAMISILRLFYSYDIIKRDLGIFKRQLFNEINYGDNSDGFFYEIDNSN